MLGRVVVLMVSGLWCVCAWGAAAKVHTVALGPVRRVPYVAADVAKEDKADEAGTLRVRALTVDGKLREWTTGDTHDVTDRSFAVRRVLHVNDTLPAEKTARWVWQPGPWVLVDRVTGRVSALRLPNFDASVSEVTWYRDYAAYCGVEHGAKSSSIVAEVWQIGARRAALQRAVGAWPQVERVRPVCGAVAWQREPMRVTIQPAGGPALTFEVVGTTSQMVEEGDADDN